MFKFFKSNKIEYSHVWRTKKPFKLFNFNENKWEETVVDEAIYAKHFGKIIGQATRVNNWIYNVWVDEKYRRKSIATKLIRLIVEDTPASTCWLWAREDALDFYHSLKSWKDFGVCPDAEERGLDPTDHLFGICTEKKDYGWSLEDQARSILKRNLKTVGWLKRFAEEDSNNIVIFEKIKKYKDGSCKTLGAYVPHHIGFSGNKVHIYFQDKFEEKFDISLEPQIAFYRTYLEDILKDYKLEEELREHLKLKNREDIISTKDDLDIWLLGMKIYDLEADKVVEKFKKENVPNEYTEDDLDKILNKKDWQSFKEVIWKDFIEKITERVIKDYDKKNKRKKISSE